MKKKQKSKIDWEGLFERSSSTEETMYFFVFGKYGIDGFEKDCEYLWLDDDGNVDDELEVAKEYKDAFKTMRKIGLKAAREDCKNWMTKTYGVGFYQERLEDYCSCGDCPIHGKD